MTTPIGYGCKHCLASFPTSAVLGGHVHAQHPEVRRPLPMFLRSPSTPTRPRRDLKRPTDAWPGKA